MSHGQSMPQPDSPHHRRFGHGFPPHPPRPLLWEFFFQTRIRSRH